MASSKDYNRLDGSTILPMQRSGLPRPNAPASRSSFEFEALGSDLPANTSKSSNFTHWFAQLDTWISEKLGLNEKRRILIRAVAGEFLVTFLFLFTVMATHVNATRVMGGSLVLSAVGTGFTAVALIYSFADVSGAHFNPLVTFATMVTGKVSIRKGLWFISMQLTASIAASAWLLVVFPNPALPDGRSATQIAIVSLPPNTSISSAFFMEFSLSAILAYVIFATAFETVDTTNNVRVGTQQPEMEIDRSVGRNLTIYTTTADSKAGFAPLAIGLCLGFLCCVGGSVSGGAFNPARVFGPAFVTGVWDGHWLYWVADLSGAAVAAVCQQLVFSHKTTQTSGAASNGSN